MQNKIIVFLGWIVLANGAFGQYPPNGSYIDGMPNAGSNYDSQPEYILNPAWWPRRNPIDRVGGELGTIGLMRETPDAQWLAIDNNGNVLLNADELQGSMQFGFKAAVDIFDISSLLGGTDMRLGYFGVNSLDTTRTISSTQVVSIFFNTIPASPPSSSNFIYSTNIYSGDATLRFMNSRRIRPLVGLRYLKIEDTYNSFNFVSGGQTGAFSLTNNSLFGGQFGAEAIVLRTGCFDWFVNGKYGILNNEVEGSARAADVSGNAAIKLFEDNSRCSLVDAEAGVSYLFVDSLEFKISYQYLFASRVATGLDQNSSVFLLSPGETVVFSSQTWQGLNVTAQFSF